MEKNNRPFVALTGGAAAAEALRQICPEVMPVYPITPQTPIIETFAKFVYDGKAATEIIQVESEHSAMSAAIGASASGVRTVTATSSQGLALMHEMLYIASGMRLPIVMLVSARALSAPLNIHGDHSDVMGSRDAGWIQIFCENPQEVYDQTIIATKLAESVKLPVMVIMDGFNTSHSVENLELLSDQTVKNFVGEYAGSPSLLDVDHPVSFGTLALQNTYFDFKLDQEEAMETVEKTYQSIVSDFEKISQRHYAWAEEYRTEEAEKLFVVMGSASGTIKEVIDELREQGKKAGLIKIRLFRPFPGKALAKKLEKAQKIAVLDRALSSGAEAPLYSLINSALYQFASAKIPTASYIFGLGGRDIFQKDIKNVFEELEKSDFFQNQKYIK